MVIRLLLLDMKVMTTTPIIPVGNFTDEKAPVEPCFMENCMDYGYGTVVVVVVSNV